MIFFSMVNLFDHILSISNNQTNLNTENDIKLDYRFRVESIPHIPAYHWISPNTAFGWYTFAENNLIHFLSSFLL